MSETMFSIDRSNNIILTWGFQVNIERERITGLIASGGMLPEGTELSIISQYQTEDDHWLLHGHTFHRRFKNGTYRRIPHFIRRLGRLARETPNIANVKPMEWTETESGKHIKCIAACDECGGNLLRNSSDELQCDVCGLIHEEPQIKWIENNQLIYINLVGHTWLTAGKRNS